MTISKEEFIRSLKANSNNLNDMAIVRLFENYDPSIATNVNGIIDGSVPLESYGVKLNQPTAGTVELVNEANTVLSSIVIPGVSDLTNYYTKSEVNSLLTDYGQTLSLTGNELTLLNGTTVLSTVTINSGDLTNYYTKTQSDAKFATITSLNTTNTNVTNITNGTTNISTYGKSLDFTGDILSLKNGTNVLSTVTISANNKLVYSATPNTLQLQTSSGTELSTVTLSNVASQIFYQDSLNQIILTNAAEETLSTASVPFDNYYTMAEIQNLLSPINTNITNITNGTTNIATYGKDLSFANSILYLKNGTTTLSQVTIPGGGGSGGTVLGYNTTSKEVTLKNSDDAVLSTITLSNLGTNLSVDSATSVLSLKDINNVTLSTVTLPSVDLTNYYTIAQSDAKFATITALNSTNTNVTSNTTSITNIVNGTTNLTAYAKGLLISGQTVRLINGENILSTITLPTTDLTNYYTITQADAKFATITALNSLNTAVTTNSNAISNLSSGTTNIPTYGKTLTYANNVLSLMNSTTTLSSVTITGGTSTGKVVNMGTTAPVSGTTTGDIYIQYVKLSAV